jgi:hypothetical protein
MKKSELRQLILAELLERKTSAEPLQENEESTKTLQGNISQLVTLFKELNIPDIESAKISNIFSLVKQGKVLNAAANKILADIFIGMLKSDDTAKLAKIFNIIKTLKTE